MVLWGHANSQGCSSLWAVPRASTVSLSPAWKIKVAYQISIIQQIGLGQLRVLKSLWRQLSCLHPQIYQVDAEDKRLKIYLCSVEKVKAEGLRRSSQKRSTLLRFSGETSGWAWFSWVWEGGGTIRANRFKMCRNSGNGNPKTECVVRIGPWGCLCGCGIRSCGGPRDGISEMAPCHPYVSPRAPLWLRSRPWCHSPQPSCLPKGVTKKRREASDPPACWEMPAAGRLCTGEPWSLPGKVLPAWHSSEHHRRRHCWQQTLRSTVLKLRVAVIQNQALSLKGGLLGPALQCKGVFIA